jgi:hypothetical protein
MKAGANFHSRKDNGVNGVNEITLKDNGMNGVNEITLRTKQENRKIVKIVKKWLTKHY